MSGGDLGDVFGPSARARRDLSGLLPPARPAAPGKPQPGPEPEQQQDDNRPPPAEQAPPPRKRARKPAATPAPSAAGRDELERTYQVSVYLLPAAITAAEKRRDEQHVTNAEIAYDAIDAMRSRLTGLVRDRRTRPRPAGSAFPARVDRRTRPRPASDPTDTEGRRVLWTIRATPAEIEILDQMVAECGASSLSELVSVAVEAALLPRTRG